MQVDGVEYYGQVVGRSNNDFKPAERPILGRKKSELGLFFPERADQPFVVDAEGVRVTIKALGVNSAPISVGDGEIRYQAAYTKTDSLHKVEKGRSEEFLYLHDETAPTSFEYELTAIEGADDVSLKSGAIVFSRSGRPTLQIEAPWVIDADGKRSDEAVRWEIAPPDDDGSRRLRLNLDPAGLRYPLTVDPSWSVISSMTMTGSFPRSVRLQNGKVLVALDNGTSSGVNLYDPSTGTWSSTGSFVAGRRRLPTLTLLQDGKVLASGGDSGGDNAMSSAELYNPSTGTWSSTGSLSQKRYAHQDVLLPDGKVLITGGYNSPSTGSGTNLAYPQLVEIYDPTNGTWSSMGNGRAGLFQTTTLLNDGKVLAVGGFGAPSANIAQVYDPTANTWTNAGDTGVRMDPTATLLNNGQVLVAGGRTSDAGGANSGLTTALLYDPVAGTWSSTGLLSNQRSSHTATLLSNGNVLVVGGQNPVGTSLSTTEIYDSTAGTWSSAGSLTTARRSHAATLLADSSVLIMGGTSNTSLSSVERYGNPNQPPTITASSGLSRVAGSASSNSTIATVTDAETAAGSLTVTVTSANPSNGVTVSNISNSNGTVTADIVAASGATSATFTLQVSDGSATATSTLAVTVSSTPPVTVDPGDGSSDGVLAQTAPGNVISLTQSLRNSSSAPVTTTYVGTLPDGLEVITGGCTVNVGACTVSSRIASIDGTDLLHRESSQSALQNNGVVTWVGTIPGNSTVTITFLIKVREDLSSGTLCITSTIGGTAATPACIKITSSSGGPGASQPFASPANQQRLGSVLIYNLYSSGTSSASDDTRITLTNTNQLTPVSVHLFLVDGSNCSVANFYLRLTQNQTVSMMASDLDPGVTGYMIAVATESNGCPTIHNDLIGETFVKFDSGHRANLPALGVAAGLLPGNGLCAPNSVTATLAFDGVRYNELPRTLAINNLPSVANGNSTMLIINRIGGDLTTGAGTLGSIGGLLFNDIESSQSFALAGGTCQLRGILGNNFPRTVPRYTNVIPAGRSGWMKFWTTADEAITGAMINESTIGFTNGHNLHSLTTTQTTTLTIPVIPNYNLR